MLIAQQIIVTATFPLHHPHQRLTLHKICHFQPFVNVKLYKTFSWGHPLLKCKKLAFSGFGNGRLRCVASIVSGAKPLSLKCLIRTFIPSILSVTSQSPLARSGILIIAVKSNFVSPFWRANLGDKNAHSSTNNSHSHFSITPFSSGRHFTQNMSHLASCKNEAFQKNFMGSPLF